MAARRGSTTWLEDAATRDPERLALIDDAGAALSYGELLVRARALVPTLADGPGPVALELEPGIEHGVAVHAAILAGRPLMSVRPGLPQAERTQVLAAGGVRRLFGPGELAAASVAGGATAAAATESGAEAIVARVLSSGTTGPRRPVDLSAANFAASAAASATNLGVETADVWLACMPMDHVGGLSILIRSVIYGTTALVHPRFDVKRVAAALSSDRPRVTGISLVPTQLRRLLDEGAPLDRLRFALIGGAALDRATLEAALDAGAPVVQSYGLTEACSQVCTLAPGEAREHLGSSGRALAPTEVRIEAGRIAVRGPTIAPGAADPDGWLRTSDLGRLDGDGYLWVLGRGDDVIVSGGENVMPEPVEEALLAHPAVAEAAVIGLPDPDWGEAVTALVVGAEGEQPDPAVLIAHCRERLAAAMVPKRILVRERLPRTSSGKLQRAALRSDLAGPRPSD